MKPNTKEIGGKSSPVLIIGAGMAGLTCAVTLHRANIPFLIFDRGNEVGGRVRTDEVDGYRLDRGFQVLLTAYPEAQRFLDYEKLELQHVIRAPRSGLKIVFIGWRILFGIRWTGSDRYLLPLVPLRIN